MYQSRKCDKIEIIDRSIDDAHTVAKITYNRPINIRQLLYLRD